MLCYFRQHIRDLVIPRESCPQVMLMAWHGNSFASVFMCLVGLEGSTYIVILNYCLLCLLMLIRLSFTRAWVQALPFQHHPPGKHSDRLDGAGLTSGEK